VRFPLRRDAYRWLERALLAIAVVGLGWYGFVFLEARLDQFLQSGALEESLNADAHTSLPVGSVIGRIEIPRLKFSAVIREGDDEHTLRLAVGHIPGTAVPGERGNAALAGHRDTFFRKLRRIKHDDEIRITTARGIQSYRVSMTRVVQPHDVWVLNATADPVLTLVTCYPFSYIGAAPDRFIVQARLTDRQALPPTEARRVGRRLAVETR
jgi:sortase A